MEQSIAMGVNHNAHRSEQILGVVKPDRPGEGVEVLSTQDHHSSVIGEHHPQDAVPSLGSHS